MARQDTSKFSTDKPDMMQTTGKRLNGEGRALKPKSAMYEKHEKREGSSVKPDWQKPAIYQKPGMVENNDKPDAMEITGESVKLDLKPKPTRKNLTV